MRKGLRTVWMPIVLVVLCGTVFAQDSGGPGNPGILAIVIAFLVAAPFLLLMLTSYVKIAVVLSILRNAFGGSDIPPKHVITGIALVLSIFVMAPVAESMYADAGGFDETDSAFSESSVKSVFTGVREGREPLRKFLARNSEDATKTVFVTLAARLAEKNEGNGAGASKDDFRILIPAFVVSQLSAAFKIGFLLFLPFLVIDLVIGSILQSAGLASLPQAAVAIPFKLLLFLFVDGWTLLMQGLVLGYT